MKFSILTGDMTISSRKFTAVTLLTSGTLAWFFLLQVYLNDLLTSIIQDAYLVDICMGLFFAFGILSAIIASLIADKVDRKKFFIIWLIIGVLSTLSLAVIHGLFLSIIFCIILGLSLGSILPSSMVSIADSTTIEERGRVSGTTILETFVIAFLAIAIITMLGEGILTIIIVISLVRLVSLFAFAIDKSEIKTKKEKTRLQKSTYREFAYYLIPWIIFALTAGLAWNLIPTEDYSSVISLGTIFRYAFIAIFGLIWGVVADRVGRKQPIILGLILLGISFAGLGYDMNETTVLFYLIISGIAWASFLTTYLAIPGDLSDYTLREKFYALVITPLIVLFGLSLLDPNFLENFPVNSFSQILSILLFLSIIPVLRAKETLKESKIRQRKMKEYTQKVGKIVQKSKKEE